LVNVLFPVARLGNETVTNLMPGSVLVEQLDDVAFELHSISNLKHLAPAGNNQKAQISLAGVRAAWQVAVGCWRGLLWQLYTGLDNRAIVASWE